MEHLERQLAEEELNSGEIRELLDRLAQEELGGSGMSTLQDVAEATGTPVNVLARMLSEIRKVPEIKQRLDVHEVRLDQHDQVIRNQRSGHSRATYADFKRFRKQEIEEENAKEWLTGIVIFVICLLVVVFLLPSASIQSSNMNHGSTFRSVDGKHGEVFTVEKSSNGQLSFTATLPDGTTRPMTEEERREHPELIMDIP